MKDVGSTSTTFHVQSSRHWWCFSLVTEAQCNLLNHFVISSDSLKMRGLQLWILKFRIYRILKNIHPSIWWWFQMYWSMLKYLKKNIQGYDGGFPKLICLLLNLLNVYKWDIFMTWSYLSLWIPSVHLRWWLSHTSFTCYHSSPPPPPFLHRQSNLYLSWTSSSGYHT